MKKMGLWLYIYGPSKTMGLVNWIKLSSKIGPKSNNFWWLIFGRPWFHPCMFYRPANVLQLIDFCENFPIFQLLSDKYSPHFLFGRPYLHIAICVWNLLQKIWIVFLLAVFCLRQNKQKSFWQIKKLLTQPWI